MMDNLKAAEGLTEKQRKLFDDEIESAYQRGRADEFNLAKSKRRRSDHHWRAARELWGLLWRVVGFIAVIVGLGYGVGTCGNALETSRHEAAKERAEAEIAAAEALKSIGSPDGLGWQPVSRTPDDQYVWSLRVYEDVHCLALTAREKPPKWTSNAGMTGIGLGCIVEAPNAE